MRRLPIALLLATVAALLVLWMLSLALRLPAAERVVARERAADVVTVRIEPALPKPIQQPPPLPQPKPAPQQTEPRAAPESSRQNSDQATKPVPTPSRPRRSWTDALDAAVLESAAAPTGASHGFDGRPTGAPSDLSRYAPGPIGDAPIWESVTTDQLGRKILRSGDCYRVLEDDNVMRLDIFETFTRYLVFCENREEKSVFTMPEDFRER